MVDCGSSEGTTNRFVCPNDRQLALRAKLKTGWSVKTASLSCHGNSSNQPLDPDEQAAIVDVIRRAEEVDTTEQERVGRLIERLDNMRRNVLGRNPSQCLLCGDGFGMLGAQRVLCVDCRRMVCQKCAIEYFSSRNVKNHWLCMICAETREIWKKSGAWFFKSIPKYILPTEKGVNYRSNGSRIMRGAKGAYKDDDSSSDEDRKIWSRIHRRNSSTESTHGAIYPCTNVHESVQDITIMASYNRQLSAGDSQSSKELEPLKNHMCSMTLSEARSWEGDPNSAEQSEASRRESTASRSLSEWNWSDTRSDDKVSPSTSSVTSSLFRSSVDEHKNSDESLGTIELSLTYDPDTMTLLCTVYRAKNLIPMDISGLADPFCKLNILPNAKASSRLRTKTVHKSRNPEFNENLTFYDITESDLMKKSLHVLVVDDDKYGHDYMGETKVALAKLKQQHTIYVNARLEKLRNEQKGPLPAPELNQWFDDLWSRGQILLSLMYSTKRRALLVNVCRCANLLPMDDNGFSDPFVKLQLRPDPYHKKYKTSIKRKNLNPVWNEEFAFETRPTELATQSLYVNVYDKDFGKRNDYLGGLVLGGTGSKGLRLKQWLDMIKYPDHRHEAWHNLTEDVLDKS